MAQMKEYTLKDYLTVLAERGFLVKNGTKGYEDVLVRNLTYHSMEVSADTLFICKGVSFRVQYLDDAVKSGAVCYISEREYPLDSPIPFIIVNDIRKAMPVIANMFYNAAWEEFKLVGITGTKGKSTTTYYIKAILDDYLESQNLMESAMISSIDLFDGVERKETHITTPEAFELHRHFRHAADSGIRYLEMEASSQALKYDRVNEIIFDVGVFLNISEDHISPIEHEDMEDYFTSKLKIFERSKVGCVNLDSDYSDRVLEAARQCREVVTFGTGEKDATIYGYDIRKAGHSILFNVRCDRFDEAFELTMPGLFNVENALAAISIAYALNIPLEFIHSGLKRARSSGRMELYASKDGKVIAIVDYAHNKLSFDKLFSSVMEEYPGYHIVAIFGCPGKKAFVRRRDLGLIAGEFSKKVYLVAEDPGYEPVEDISRDIAQYVEQKGCPYEMIEDRGEAISKAIHEATDNTVILITGKGNETRQKYGCEYLDYPSDVEFTVKYIKEYDELHPVEE